MHLLRSCQVVEKFWTQIIDITQRSSNVHIPERPDLCCLEIFWKIHSQELHSISFLSVKRTELMKWKIGKPDCFNITDILNLLSMESVASVFSDCDTIVA